MKNKIMIKSLIGLMSLSLVACGGNDLSSTKNSNYESSLTNSIVGSSTYSSIDNQTSSSISSSSNNISSSNDEGTVTKQKLKKETYEYLMSGLKLNNTSKYVTAELTDGKLVEKSSFMETNTIIYEETEDSEYVGSYKTYNPTDRYENIFYDSNGKEVDRRVYVVTTGKNVGYEYISLQNEVETTPYIYDETAKTKWISSLYQNLFMAYYSEENEFTENNFSSTDGIHYDLESEWMLYADLFFKSLYLDNGSLARFGIEVKDDKPVAIYGNTYASKDDNTYYYLQFRAEVVLDDVKTSRLQKYERKDYHDRIDQAIEKALENNYTAVIDDGTLVTTYKFTENLMTVETSNGSPLVGYYPYKNGRAQFKYEDGKYIQSAVSEGSFDEVFPTFDISSEILMGTSNDNIFVNHDGLERYAAYFAYGGWESFITGQSTLELTNDNELKKLNYSYNYDGELTNVTVTFSNFGTTTIDINIDDIELPAEATSWLEYDEGVYNSMIEYFGDDYLPFIIPAKGWNTETGINYMKNYGYYVFKTNSFASADDRDAFIEEYSKLLLENGFTESDTTYDDITDPVYTNGVIDVVVTQYSYGAIAQLLIFVK